MKDLCIDSGLLTISNIYETFLHMQKFFIIVEAVVVLSTEVFIDVSIEVFIPILEVNMASVEAFLLLCLIHTFLFCSCS